MITRENKSKQIENWYKLLEKELMDTSEELLNILNRYVLLSVEYQQVALKQDSMNLRDVVCELHANRTAAEVKWEDFIGEWDKEAADSIGEDISDENV